MAGLVGGPGGGAPRPPENVRKFAKDFLKKISRIHYFSLFFKKFQNYAFIFARLDEKLNWLGKF